MIPAWNGVGEFSEEQARALAGLGYAALVADIYGKGIRPKDMKAAAAQAGIYRADRPLMRARARAGLDALAAQPQVDAKRLAAIGYCFGGGVALELARSGAPLVATVSFHGNLDTPHPDDAKNVRGRVLALAGGDDPYVTADQRTAFEQEMRQAGVDWELNVYGGAVHAYMDPRSGNDPSKGMAYNEKAARRSWEAMQRLFREVF